MKMPGKQYQFAILKCKKHTNSATKNLLWSNCLSKPNKINF